MNKIVQTFYISTGRLNAMYTLRCSRHAQGGGFSAAFDHYICNLSTDVELAQQKASAYFDAWKDRSGLEDTEDFRMILDLDPENQIGARRGRLSKRDTMALEDIESGIAPFGKHAGQKFCDMPADYVLYFADKYSVGDTDVVMSAFKAACLGFALESGMIAKRDADKAARRAADLASVHVGVEGERREFCLKVAKVLRFEGQFGFTYINICHDEDGNVVVYKGSNGWTQGETCRCKATVKKHDQRDGVNQTLICRPALV
jgi:uncharacterized protein (DUF3820 family)